MSTAPWWATGVFTLGGVLLAQFAAFALSRSRDKFEDSRRWHEDRRDIYLAVIISAWKIQDAVFNHFEADQALPDNLSEIYMELATTQLSTQLVGSEEVIKVTEQLTTQASVAMMRARQAEPGKALDACDSIRHMLYYLTDLMRSELTSNRAAARQWHRNSRRRLRLRERRNRTART